MLTAPRSRHPSPIAGRCVPALGAMTPCRSYAFMQTELWTR